MRQQLLLVVVFALLSASSAQLLLPKANIYVGYSHNQLDLMQGAQNRQSLNGWNASAELKVLPFVGLVGDFSGHYGNATGIGPLCPAPACSGSSSISIKEHNYLFGPRVSVSVGRITPFAHALFGGAHISGTSSDTSFATALGGGVDWKLRGPLGWRVAQVDYLQTRFFSGTQNNFRIGTGLVLRF